MTATVTDWRTELKDDFDPDDENIPTPKDVRDVLLFDPDDPEWKPGEVKASRPVHPAIKKADRVRGKLAAIYREALRKLLEKYEGRVLVNIRRNGAKVTASEPGIVQAGAPEGHPFYGNQWTDESMSGGGGVKTIKIGHTSLDYGVSSDEKTAELTSVETPIAKRGRGEARNAIVQFLRQTDKRNMTVKLWASPRDRKTDSARLVKFYKSLGFVETGREVRRGEPEMVRVPKSPISASGSVIRATIPVAEDFLFRLVDFSADFFAAMRDAGTEAIQLGAVAALRDLGEDEHLTDKGVVQDFLIKRENKLKDVPQEVYDRIKRAIEEANVEGMSEKNAADYLREQVGDAFDEIYEGRAETICRTESASAYGTAAHSALKQAGFSSKKWVSSHDADVRPSHQDVDGEVVGADEEFSNGLMYPGDPDGDADEVCNCRCTLVAVDDSEDEE